MNRLGFVDGSFYLTDQFKNNSNFTCGKIGANELLVLRNYYQYTQENKDIVWNESILNNLFVGAGVFPSNITSVFEFIDEQLKSLSYIDCYALWSMNDINFEYSLINHFNPNSVFIELQSLEPFYFGSPWSEYLQDKKVLVISPFVESIKKQYTNRKFLWDDSRVLPDFDLITLYHPASYNLYNEKPHNYSSWLEMVNVIKGQMNKIDYDVALIGTGASSLSLVAEAKKHNKSAIHLGGGLQILFGIKGGRWDFGNVDKFLYNDYWIRPNIEETPILKNINENGCYW